jgi:hypothetical protein
MHDSDVTERRLKDAFAGVTATAGVDSWRQRTPTAHRMRGIGRAVAYGIRPGLLEVALTAGIAAALLIVSVAGTFALSHSRAAHPVSAHSSAAPATTKTASPGPTATIASACSRVETPTSLYGFRFGPPGTVNPPISCSKAIATIRCPPEFAAGNPCNPITGQITAELMLLSTAGPVGEVRASGGPYMGPPFRATNLLAWRLTFVPTACRVDANGVQGSDMAPFAVFSQVVQTRCQLAEDYLIDATTGDWVFFDAGGAKKG